MQKRYFTVDEANEMIPLLEAAFTRILQMRRQMSEVFELLEMLDAAPSGDNFEIEVDGASPAVIHNRATLKALIEAIDQELVAIRSTGCLVKTIDTGLVDWYCHRHGRDVFLCWRFGEKEVRYWHDTRAGVRGRRPIEELHEISEAEEAELESSCD